MRDKKRVKNVVADHLSRLPTDGEAKDPLPINEHFLDEQLFQITTHTNTLTSWYADITNYLATGKIPLHWSSIDKKKFFRNVRYFFRTILTCLSIVLTKLSVDVFPTMR